ncbi:MAG: PilC/PilY family type IV pilus protein [bacterium]
MNLFNRKKQKPAISFILHTEELIYSSALIRKDLCKYFILLFFFFFFFSSIIIIPSAKAKMRPLRIIDNLLVRPNILIIFDTSGSMQRDPNCKVLNTADSKGRKYGAHEDSRLAIAKSVVFDVLNETRRIANFGLMTFNQTHYGLSSAAKGYYTYYRAGSGPLEYNYKYCSKEFLRSPIFTVNEKPRQMANDGDPNYRPIDSFTHQRMTYTLKSTDNSVYHRRVKGKDHILDHNYCGFLCEIADPNTGILYTWEYKGSYYGWMEVPKNDQLVYFNEYYGPQFISDGTEECSICPVDPNEVFIYYQGYNDVDFLYSEYATFPSPYPVEVPDETSKDQGGILIVPFSFSGEQEDQDIVVDKIQQWMGPQNDGGLIATGSTPTGSTLKNATLDTDFYNDAYSYFVNDVFVKDTLWCRNNYILLITDGEPTPAEEITGAISAASSLFNDTNVTVYVVGFGAETVGSTILDKIANSGGSPLKSDSHYAYYTKDRESLKEAIKKVIYQAAAGDYATSAPTSGSNSNSWITGNVGLLATCEFPDWKGHLIAVDLATGFINWDAGEMLDANHISYNKRKIFTSSSDGKLVPFFDGSGNPNASPLHSLGMGASVEEAKEIIEFISGKNNFWRLYDITNCTPIAIGPPFKAEDPSVMLGHDAFEVNYKTRHTVVYAGGNDCMLHAFDMSTGKEIFAYVPPDLIANIQKIFLKKGQPTSPSEHIYGVSASPKAHDVFFDGQWRTIVVCGEGPGGYCYFAIDVTHPSPSDPDYNPSAPFSVLWHTGYGSYKSKYDPIVGEAWSTPAMGKISYKEFTEFKSKHVAFFGSGYDDPTSADTEGLTFMAAGFNDGLKMGDIVFSKNLGTASTIVDHGLVADGVCYENDGLITDAYMVDTAGRIWHSKTVGNPSSWTMDVIYDAGVNQPFFYSPPVLQIGSRASKCTLIAAASGTYDDPAINKIGSTFEAKLHILRLNSSDVVAESIIIPFTDIIMDTSTNEKFPLRARINSSPIIAKNEASSSYELIFLVYVPPAAVGCDYGDTYLVAYKLGILGVCGLENIKHITTMHSGEGKVTGVDIVGDPSAVLVGISGHGSGKRSKLKTLPSTPSFAGGTVRELYWKDDINRKY